MRPIYVTLIAFVGLVTLPTLSALAEPKIDEDLLAPTGKWRGYTISPRGVHVAALASKGSRFVVVVDGVEGPRIDQMLSADGSPYLPAMTAQPRPIPVVFSSDGAHYAYFAKVGDEFIVMLDGKELARGKYDSGTLTSGLLAFSAGGKHLYYSDSTGGYHIVMDGKPGPISHTPPRVVTSPDGTHYAYVGTQPDGQDTPWAVVDGKQVKYFGGDLQFSAKGHLFAILKGKGEMALNVDGRNIIVANNISQFSISPNGGGIAAVVYNAKAGKAVLMVNGKSVPGTEGVLIQKVFFSPDDKHYAALCTGGTGAYMIIDGKKGQQYQAIGDAPANGIAAARSWVSGLPIGTQMTLDAAGAIFPGFTSDSSSFVYGAQSGGKFFLVTNDDESDGYPAISPVLSPDGKHMAFIASQGYKKPAVGLDGKIIPLKGRDTPPLGGPATSLAFTPDGAHLITTYNGGFFVDGIEMPGINCAGQYAYSPDSQHMLMVAGSASNPNIGGLFLDGKLVASGPGVTNTLRPTFTPDSKHVFWIGNRPSATSDDHDNAVLYVDGKPVPIQFVPDTDPTTPGNWEMSPEGVLTFVARTGEDLKRYHVTPAADRSLITMLAEAVGAGHK